MSKPTVSIIAYSNDLHKNFVSQNVVPEPIASPEITILRVDDNIFFVNVNILKDTVHNLVNSTGKYSQRTPPQVLILDLSTQNNVDSSFIRTLDELNLYLSEKNIVFMLTRFKAQVFDVMKSAGIGTYIPVDLCIKKIDECYSVARKMKSYRSSTRSNGFEGNFYSQKLGSANFQSKQGTVVPKPDYSINNQKVEQYISPIFGKNRTNSSNLNSEKKS